MAGRRLSVSLCIVALALSGCTGAGDSEPQASEDPSDEFGSIEGSIVDEESQPIPGAEVGLVEAEFKTTSDATGAYVLSDVPPGTYTIAFLRIGYESISRRIDVEASQVATLDIVLSAVPVYQEPIVTTVIYEGLLRCGWNSGYSQNLCGEALGGNVNHWAFTLDPSPEFFRAIMEVVWEPTTAVTGGELEIDICPPQGLTGGNNVQMCDPAYGFRSGPSPQILPVEPGDGGDFSDELPWPDVLDYEMWVGSGFQYPNPTYDQRFTVYFTTCYVEDCEDYSAIPTP